MRKSAVLLSFALVLAGALGFGAEQHRGWRCREAPCVSSLLQIVSRPFIERGEKSGVHGTHGTEAPGHPPMLPDASSSCP